MFQKQNLSKVFTAMTVIFVLAMISCQEDEPEQVTTQDTSDLTEEALTDALFLDLDDMAGLALAAPSETEYSGGRTANTITIPDSRFECESIVITLEPDALSTSEVPKGVVTVDFGAGCTDPRGNLRTGKLIFSYDGKRFMPGSSVVITTDNYYINGIKLEGTRTLTNVQASTASAPRFNAVLTGGKAVFADGLSVTRESDITFQWNRAANPDDDSLEIDNTSTASGTTRKGRAYSVTVLEDLIYKRHCGIAVSGVKQYTVGGREISINFGSGECDRQFTISVNGVTRTITL